MSRFLTPSFCACRISILSPVIGLKFNFPRSAVKREKVIVFSRMFSKTPGPTNLFVSLLLEPLKRYEHCPESHVFDAPKRANAPARTPMQLLLVYVKHTIYSQSQPNSGNFIRAQISFLQKFMIMLIFRRPKWGLIQGEVPRFRHRLHPYIRPVAMGSFRAVSLKCCAQSKNLSILKTHVPPQTVKDPLKIFESSGGVLR